MVVPAVVQLAARPRQARRNPSTWLPESPMNTVALYPGRRLNGRKPEAGEPERKREREDEVVLVDRGSVDREVGARDGRERRREPVHVVEEVEGVGDPDQPDERDHDADQIVPDQLDPEPTRDRQPGGGELRDQLGDRAQVRDVVEKPGAEEEHDPGDDSRQLPASRDRTDRKRCDDAGKQAGREPHAPEGRRRAVVPALVGRHGNEPLPERRGAEEGPEDD